MKEDKISERKSIVGNFTVRKTGKGEKRFDGRYLVIKRTGSNRWAVCEPCDDQANVDEAATGREFFDTREAAIAAARERFAQ